ncbi:hypothetical protein ACHAXR_012941 [Thalassiosira sp. AJA248-18]
MDSSKTADEMIASVDATLANWRSAFESSSPRKERANNADAACADADGGGASSPTAKSPPSWKDPGAYQRRLGTFKPNTYFAKPLALSPLVCAAFGWENTGNDIIKCRDAACGATICVLFHPSLNEESRDKLCEKYLGMLVSSHTSGCPFRSFANRWSKVMHQCGSKKGEDCGNKPTLLADIITKENNPENLMNKVSAIFSKSNFYVPPYLLSLSEDFLRFEDCTEDGSNTRDLVKEGTLQIRDQQHSRTDGDSTIDVTIPDVVTKFCCEVLPDADVDEVLHLKDTAMKVPYLLSVFGWSLCDESVGETTSVVVKCNLCQARSWLTPSPETDEESSRKRRRIDTRGDANLKLIESHRIYCPYVSGFNSADLAGWKVVVSNLLKSAAHAAVECNANLS